MKLSEYSKKYKPELKKIVDRRGINAVKPVVTIATKETDRFWAKKVEKMSKNTLETYVRDIRIEIEDKMESQKVLPRKKIIEMELSPETATELENLKGNTGWEEIMKEYIEMKKRQLEAKKPEKVETKSRHIPEKIKRHIQKRSKGKCEYPACTKNYTILHHIDRFALKKEHDPDRIVALCKGHERLAHLSLIENEEKSTQYWRVRKNPNKWDLKYSIDQRVNEFRAGYP